MGRVACGRIASRPWAWHNAGVCCERNLASETSGAGAGLAAGRHAGYKDCPHFSVFSVPICACRSRLCPWLPDSRFLAAQCCWPPCRRSRLSISAPADSPPPINGGGVSGLDLKTQLEKGLKAAPPGRISVHRSDHPTGGGRQPAGVAGPDHLRLGPQTDLGAATSILPIRPASPRAEPRSERKIAQPE